MKTIPQLLQEIKNETDMSNKAYLQDDLELLLEEKEIDIVMTGTHIYQYAENYTACNTL